MLILVGILSGYLGRNIRTTVTQKNTTTTLNSAGLGSKDLIHCVLLMQENQTGERRVKCERLTPETLIREIRVWGHWELGVETLLERRHLVGGRAEGQAATAASSHPSTMNDQGLKCIPWHPRHLERTAFEDLVLAPHQLKLRYLLIMC